MATVKVGELNIEYYVEGSGPPLLMIMGLGGQAASIQRQSLIKKNRGFPNAALIGAACSN